MKAILFLFSLCMAICSSGQFSLKSLKNVFVDIPLYDTTLKDRDGNNYRTRIMPDNRLWMIDNLRINVPGSFCYDDKKEHCETFGRLYNWETAQQICVVLGQGWRLPTDEEWRQLAKNYGGVFGDSQDSGKSVFKALVKGGKAGFDIELGGGRGANGEFRRGNDHGFYWTATEIDSTSASFLNFGKGSGKLFHQRDGQKSDAFSVRCIRDITVPK